MRQRWRLRLRAAGQCYYVDEPAEAVALQAAGLCPVNWAPAPMPMAWRSQYSWYYDSPSYYSHYVPVSRRTTYVTHVHVYEKTNPRAVVRAPKAAAPRPQSSFRSGSGRQGGDAGTSRVSYSSRSGFSSGSRSGSGSSSGGGFRSGSRR